MKTDIADGFTKEFDATLARMAEIVGMVRDEDWATGRTPRETPVHQVCHAVSVVLRYAHAEGDWADINFRWKPQTAHPSRERLLKLIDRARKAMAPYVADVADRTLADRSWRFPPLHKLIYLLRHTTWHLCSLCEELKRRGYRITSHYTKTWKWARGTSVC